MIARVDLEGVRQPIAGQDAVECADGSGDADIAVAGIESQRLVGLQVGQVLIHHRERGVGCPFRDDLRYGLAVGDGQSEIPRRVAWIG